MSLFLDIIYFRKINIKVVKRLTLKRKDLWLILVFKKQVNAVSFDHNKITENVMAFPKIETFSLKLENEKVTFETSFGVKIIQRIFSKAPFILMIQIFIVQLCLKLVSINSFDSEQLYRVLLLVIILKDKDFQQAFLNLVSRKMLHDTLCQQID